MRPGAVIKIISVNPACAAPCTGPIPPSSPASPRSATTSSPASLKPNAKAGPAKPKASKSASPAPRTSSPRSTAAPTAPPTSACPPPPANPEQRQPAPATDTRYVQIQRMPNSAYCLTASLCTDRNVYLRLTADPRSPVKPGDSPGYALTGNAERRIFAPLRVGCQCRHQAQINQFRAGSAALATGRPYRLRTGGWASRKLPTAISRLARSGDTGEGGGSYRYVFDCNTARDRSPSHVSHTPAGSRMWVGRWGNHPAAGQYLAPVVEHDHAVAQQAPPLLRVKGDDAGGVAVRALSRGAGGPVWTHYAPLIWAPDVPVWGAPVL